jgi:hypothetical protein
MALGVWHKVSTQVASRPLSRAVGSKEQFILRASARDNVNRPLTAIHFDEGETHVETT